MPARESRKWLTGKHGFAALAAGAGLVQGAAEADAAVIHTPIGCTIKLAVDSACGIDVDGDKLVDLNVFSESTTRAYGSGTITYRHVIAIDDIDDGKNVSFIGTQGSATADGSVDRFEASSLPKGSSSGGEGGGGSSSSSAVLQASPPAEPAAFNDLDGEAFLGVKISTLNPPSETFGWIRVIGDASAGTLTFFDAGYETDPLVPLVIGLLDPVGSTTSGSTTSGGTTSGGSTSGGSTSGGTTSGSTTSGGATSGGTTSGGTTSGGTTSGGTTSSGTTSSGTTPSSPSQSSATGDQPGNDDQPVTDQDAHRMVSTTAVPAPPSIGLMALGAGAVLALRRGLRRPGQK
jgi:hypothetical protein